MPRTIVLGVDDSKHALHAVDAVRELAQATGDEVIVLHVHEVTVGHGDRARVEDNEAPTDFLDGYVERLSESGVRARGEVVEALYGRIAHAILEAADAVDARLVAVGSRGRSDIGALALGSVSHQLVNLAHRPVLVVRHD